jgi:hypothetical protein
MVKPLPIGELRAFISNIRLKHPDEDAFGLAQVAAYHLLAAILGDDWVETHIFRDKSPTHFFRNASTDDYERTKGRLRVIQLAEMVFNLQRVEGLNKSITMIRAGDIEAGFAELEVGRILHASDRVFEFVTPKGIKGDDYDLELLFSDVVVCCETKCKVEATAISEHSLIRTLHSGRKQLPEDKPGIIFVKLPQTWYEAEDSFVVFLSETATKFLRNTGRIVSIKFYSSVLFQTETELSPRILFLEINNEFNRFYRDRDWNIFKDNNEFLDGWVVLMSECA